MKDNDIPDEVLKWIMQQTEPFLFIVTPHPLGNRLNTETDPETVEEMYKAYMEALRKRLKKKKK